MSQFTRSEHMQWAKDRALAYLDDGDVANARGSMLSDLAKHPETAGMSQFALLSSMTLTDPDSVRRWIEGFAA